MLTKALMNEMISKKDNSILAEFIYNKQTLPLNLTSALQDKIRFGEDVEPID
jgi:hypothetical protein